MPRMNPTVIACAGLAAAAGACIALQAAANSRFRTHLDSPWFAAFFSICGTIACAGALMALYVAARRPPVPDGATLRNTPWWYWVGGPLGMVIVLAGAALTRELGAAAFIALVVAGQLVASLLLEHFALMGLPASPITAPRAAGAALIVAGVVLIKFWN